MRISDWSSDVCSSDLHAAAFGQRACIDRRCGAIDGLVAGAGRLDQLYRRAARRAGGEGGVPLRCAGALCRRSAAIVARGVPGRSEEHTSELQSLMRISYAVFCLKKKNTTIYNSSNNF